MRWKTHKNPAHCAETQPIRCQSLSVMQRKRSLGQCAMRVYMSIAEAPPASRKLDDNPRQGYGDTSRATQRPRRPDSPDGRRDQWEGLPDTQGARSGHDHPRSEGAPPPEGGTLGQPEAQGQQHPEAIGVGRGVHRGQRDDMVVRHRINASVGTGGGLYMVRRGQDRRGGISQHRRRPGSGSLKEEAWRNGKNAGLAV